MVPRVKMVCLYEGQSFEENFEIIKKNILAFRYVGEIKDDIKGIIQINGSEGYPKRETRNGGCGG
ncbi:hypothetical protein SAMN06265361_102111 [Laceyella tengchongensis]|uniref:Uncharacterized protein n=2 Tax=Laceyella tengchongensis TaxID=574699 RepID=A0AA45WL65_9BACL|nr:hypothetical protein SAMN06265361_102111 [Laceyella tengchongensis]